MSGKIEEMLKARAEKRDALKKMEEEQFARDLEALMQLEEEYGYGNIVGVKVNFTPGLPTRAFLRVPDRAQYQKYRDNGTKAVGQKNTKGHTDALDVLAKSCWAYPKEHEAKEAMLEATPGLLASIGHEAIKLAEGKAEEEGKD